MTCVAWAALCRVVTSAEVSLRTSGASGRAEYDRSCLISTISGTPLVWPGCDPEADL